MGIQIQTLVKYLIPTLVRSSLVYSLFPITGCSKNTGRWEVINYNNVLMETGIKVFAVNLTVLLEYITCTKYGDCSIRVYHMHKIW